MIPLSKITYHYLQINLYKVISNEPRNNLNLTNNTLRDIKERLRKYKFWYVNNDVGRYEFEWFNLYGKRRNKPLTCKNFQTQEQWTSTVMTVEIIKLINNTGELLKL